MQTSEQIGELAAALSKTQGEVEGAKKDANNPFFHSKYADLASVWDACRKPLSKNGLAVVQFPNTEYLSPPEPYEWVSKSGEKQYGVRVMTKVSVLTRLVHSSGQFMEDSCSTMLATGGPQAVGSAITYLRRYALQSVVGIAPEDDDGNDAEDPERPRTAPQPMPPPQAKPQPKASGANANCPGCGAECGPSQFPKSGATHYCRTCKAPFDPDVVR